MGQEVIGLSHGELDRLEVVQSVERGELTQKEAALRLQLSTRQVKRIVQRYRQQGAAGLISRHRGKPANNAIEQAVRRQIMDLAQTHYADFKPSFACEKINELHGLDFLLSTYAINHDWSVSAALSATIIYMKIFTFIANYHATKMVESTFLVHFYLYFEKKCGLDILRVCV